MRMNIDVVVVAVFRTIIHWMVFAEIEFGSKRARLFFVSFSILWCIFNMQFPLLPLTRCSNAKYRWHIETFRVEKQEQKLIVAKLADTILEWNDFFL